MRGAQGGAPEHRLEIAQDAALAAVAGGRLHVGYGRPLGRTREAEAGGTRVVRDRGSSRVIVGDRIGRDRRAGGTLLELCTARPLLAVGGELLAEDGHDDRLRDVVVHARLEALVPVAAHGVGRYRHDEHWRARHASLALPTADRARGAEAIEYRHVAVHQDHVEHREPLVVVPLHRLHRLLTVTRHRDPVPHVLEHLLGHVDVVVVVLDEQHAQRPHVRRLRLRARLVHVARGRGALGHGQLDGHRGPLAEARAHRELALHQADELLADGDAEAGAAAHVRVLLDGDLRR
mmetsp:Transcript_20286/g.51398  ORF Transcript_20286/g.51398 Transcript_20286/m.51398 type:complete len:291 (-) Transcript_20286:259-1131(-)